MVFKRYHQLPSVPWADGAPLQFTVKDLPSRGRIEAFVFRLEGVFTTGAAAAAIASTQLHRLAQQIQIGPRIIGSGQFWRFMQWTMRGCEGPMPAGLPAANAEVHRRHITWEVPFYDPRSQNPWDDCPIGADFENQVIIFNSADFTTLGAGTWSTLASITGTLRCYAVMAPPTDKPGAVVEFMEKDLTGQTPTVEGTALYTDLFLFRTSAATVDSAQVATCQIAGDSQAYVDITRLHEFACEFNRRYSKGSDPQAASATAPIGGELLPESPAVTAGAAATVTMPFTPLIIPPPGYVKSNLLAVENTLTLNFTGTDTTFHVGYRRVIPHNAEEVVARFRKLGVPVQSMDQVGAATASGKAVRGQRAGLGRYLPVKLRGAK